VLLISVRAHGDSTGDVNDFGYGARHDIIAAVEFLEKRRPGRPVLLLGISLGSAASVFAAKELGERIHGCLLELPYRDLRTASRNRMQAWLPVGLEYVAYSGLMAVAPLILPIDAISPIDAITSIPSSVPVWILAGERDAMARLPDVEALHERVATHGRLVVFPEAGHESLLKHDPERYTAAVEEWLAQVRSSASPQR
jgi:alpha-beta hydrolase superfamily lysophospholipase